MSATGSSMRIGFRPHSWLRSPSSRRHLHSWLRVLPKRPDSHARRMHRPRPSACPRHRSDASRLRPSACRSPYRPDRRRAPCRDRARRPRRGRDTTGRNVPRRTARGRPARACGPPASGRDGRTPCVRRAAEPDGYHAARRNMRPTTNHRPGRGRPNHSARSARLTHPERRDRKRHPVLQSRRHSCLRPQGPRPAEHSSEGSLRRSARCASRVSRPCGWRYCAQPA